MVITFYGGIICFSILGILGLQPEILYCTVRPEGCIAILPPYYILDDWHDQIKDIVLYILVSSMSKQITNKLSMVLTKSDPDPGVHAGQGMCMYSVHCTGLVSNTMHNNTIP